MIDNDQFVFWNEMLDAAELIHAACDRYIDRSGVFYDPIPIMRQHAMRIKNAVPAEVRMKRLRQHIA